MGQELTTTCVKPVPGYPEYFATRDGHVLTIKRGRLRQLSEQIHSTGYVYVSLTRNGKTSATLLHRVIASAFISNPNNLRDVNHKNLDKQDNRPENLEWLSHADNCRHARNAGKGKAKLTDEMRAEIYSGAGSDVALAKKFGVSVSTVRQCRIGSTYKGARPTQMALRMQ